ncbi:arginase family protein [Williamsia sterculiae]|uniref:Arginase n=1 Tax=Williamsia sterculiae TaxID=1344003 RepID=A0A1N7FV80_9NOCA|nr:arginase family protein [Williamsia sterculiae]SIS04135.1 arginase [Williamsia sterculiae]
MSLRIIGVPDSAGAYCVGVEHAPAALRQAGLITEIVTAGGTVHDAGDLTVRRWRPDRVSPRAQNVDDEVSSLREVSDAVADGLTAGDRVLVVGGSCTVAVGVCAALDRVVGRARLVYIDRHLDLNTPSSTEEGSLSWMGMAHALNIPGAVPEVAGFAGPTTILRPDDLVYLGVQPSATTEWERAQLDRLGVALIDQSELVAAPHHAAASAAEVLSPGPFGVHLDVDVLDFLDAPLAENVNGRNTGPTLEQLEPALDELWSRDGCRVLSIGQLVPAHAESDPTVLPRFVQMLGRVLPESS